jgi:glutathione synthase/RimK-type ligase-like ATP-grasp enzyme
MNSDPQVIVITDHRDAHLPYVQRHLENCIVIDPMDLVDGKTLTVSETSEGTNITYDGTLLDRVSGVWYRKPQPIKDAAIPVKEELRGYSRSAIERQFMILTSALPDATWVSNYHAGLRASSKALQLQVARQVGFNAPDTIFTGSPHDARAFLRKHPVSVTKRMSNANPTVDGTRTVFLTTRIDKTFTPDLTNLHLAPAIFQQAIDAKHDIRVTVVGDKVFPAYVKSKSTRQDGRIRDSRAGYFGGSVDIQPVPHFPAALADLCVAHTKALGLNFGAIDIVEDPEGTYWFIENNANGQWAYIEEATGLGIGKAVATLLMNGKV